MDLRNIRKQILKNDAKALQSLLDNYEGLIRKYTYKYYSRFEDKDEILTNLAVGSAPAFKKMEFVNYFLLSSIRSLSTA